MENIKHENIGACIRNMNRSNPHDPNVMPSFLNNKSAIRDIAIACSARKINNFLIDLGIFDADYKPCQDMLDNEFWVSDNDFFNADEETRGRIDTYTMTQRGYDFLLLLVKSFIEVSFK